MSHQKCGMKLVNSREQQATDNNRDQYVTRLIVIGDRHRIVSQCNHETFYDMKMPKIWCKSCPQNAKFNLVAYQRTFIGESEIHVFVRFISVHF